MSAPAGSSPAAPPTPPDASAAPPKPVAVHRSGSTGLYVVIGVLVVVVIIVAAGSVTSWFGLTKSSSSSGCPTGVTIQGAGAAFPSSLISVWTSQFNGATSDLVNYQASGAGTGITDLTSKLVDFAVTDEPLVGTQASQMNAAVGTTLTLPIMGGAVSIIYYIPGFTGTLQLNGTELFQIFNGNITTWDNGMLVGNNPGLSTITTSILVVERSDAAGMSYVLSNYLSDVSSYWASKVGTSIQPSWPTWSISGGGKNVPEPGNSAVIKEVAGNAGAIGYTDLYDAGVHSLPSAQIQNHAGDYVAPSVASTKAAVTDIYNAATTAYPTSTGNWSAVTWVNGPGSGDYPLATLVYAMLPEEVSNGYTFSMTSAQVLVLWFHWVLTTGQSFNQTAYPFIDPPSALVSQALTGLSAVNFKGSLVSVCS